MGQSRNGRDWRGGAAAGAGVRPVVPLSIAAAVLLGLMAAWLWTLRKPDSDAHFISLALSQYEAPWPPVPFADADARRLHEVLGGAPDVSRQEKERYDAGVADLANLKAHKVIVYVTGLAAVADSRVFILTSHARPAGTDWQPADDGNWHPLEALLQAFDQCPAPGGKLLLLDLAHVIADPECGVDTSHVSRRVCEVVDSYLGRAGPALVLVAAGPGQSSQPMPETGATAFAYFTARNLRWPLGHALHQPITARQLSAAVQDQVQRWAKLTRAAAQTPYLVGGGDFVIRYPSEDAEPVAQAVPYPDWLAKEWAARDAIDRQVWAATPHVARRLDTLLARSDARFRAGVALATVEADYRKDGPRLIEQARRATDFKPVTLKTVEGIDRDAVRPKLRTWLENADAKVKLSDALGDAGKKPEVVLAAAWDEVCDRAIERDRLVALVGQACGPPPEADTPEAVFLILLKRLADQQRFRDGQRAWPVDLIRAAARVERSFLAARAAVTPTSYRPLKDRMDRLTAQRAAAEQVLWSLGEPRRAGDEPVEIIARRCLDRYQSPDGIEQAARGLKADADEANRASAAVTEAVNVLPAYVPVIANLEAKAAGAWIDGWDDAARSAAALADLLDGLSPSAEFPAEAVRRLRTEVEAGLAALRLKLDGILAATPMTASAASAVLAAPILSAKERKEYWDRWHAGWCVEKTRGVFENAGSYPPPREPAAPAVPPVEAGPDRLRERLAAGLAGLAGSRGAADVWRRPAGPRAAGVIGAGGTTEPPERRPAQLRSEFCRWQVESYSQEAAARGLSGVALYTDADRSARAAQRHADGLVPPS
jgi:hypothetical protein